MKSPTRHDRVEAQSSPSRPPKRTTPSFAQLDADAAARTGHRLARVPALSDGGALPHLETIQRAFGAHSLAGVRAHQGDAARAAAQRLGAAAFTVDDEVAFARAPSLHVAAHEAAHVIQKRTGAPAGGDFEAHADAVAARVVAGRDAAPLFDALRPSHAAPPELQRFKDDQHREMTFEVFNSCKPDMQKAMHGLLNEDSLTVADRRAVVEQADWIKPEIKKVMLADITRGDLHKEIELAEQENAYVKMGDSETAHATVDLFHYLSLHAEEFTEYVVPLLEKHLEALKLQFAEQLNTEHQAYEQLSLLVDSELLRPLEEEVMQAIQRDIPDAKARGLVIPIVEFAQNANFFYDDSSGTLVPEAAEQWAEGIRGMLAQGQKAADEAALSVDPKQRRRFVQALASGGCYPARTRDAEASLKPPIAANMQGTLNQKLQGAEEDQLILRSLYAFQEFFLEEQHVDPNKKNLTVEEMERVNSRVFKAYILQHMQQDIQAKGKKLVIEGEVIDKFIKEVYPFIHAEDVEQQVQVVAQDIVIPAGGMQARFDGVLAGDAMRMKLEVGQRFAERAGKTIYEITEVDAAGRKYKLKVAQNQNQ